MKAIFGTLAISVALPIAVTAQVSSGGAAGGTGSAGAARSAGVAGSGAVSPSGSLAGGGVGGTVAAPGGTVRAPGGTVVTPGGTVTAPGGTVAVPGGTVTAPGGNPVGPLNPGGISGRPIEGVGRTFDRSIIGGGPTDTVIDPAEAQPIFRFPPESVVPGPRDEIDTLGSAGGFPPSTFPAGPVGVGNIVGTNMSGVLTSAVPRETVTVNLPPGTRIVTNAFGVSEVVAVPPAVVGTNIGGATGLETGADSGIIVPPTDVPRIVAPRATPPPPPVTRGPILDGLDRER